MHPKISAVLSASSIAYTVYRHEDFSLPIHSPQDFASVLGCPIASITKSVLFRGEPAKVYSLAVCSVDRKMNLKLLADLSHVKRVQVASEEELHKLTDYPTRGVSPLGLQDIAIYMDEALLALPVILIGAGEVGVEIKLSPIHMIPLAQAQVVPLT